MEDAAAIEREASAVAGVAPIKRKLATSVRRAERQTDTPILFGVTPSYEFTLSQYVGRGRFITEYDLNERSNVCVLAHDVV
ncbi:ABC transporter permease, partial [Acinetobacter baumannii]